MRPLAKDSNAGVACGRRLSSGFKKRSIYGLKQAPRAWNARFVNFITNQGFKRSKNDTSLFTYAKNGTRAYLILYVDNIVITASTSELRNSVIAALKMEFPITDEGQISSFLGISAQFNDKGLFLNQSRYAEEIIERAGMKECKPCATPVDLKAKLSDKEGKAVDNPTEYRSMAGALQYLTFTRPDISYAVQQICLFMHDPREPHLAALKRVNETTWSSAFEAPEDFNDGVLGRRLGRLSINKKINVRLLYLSW